MTTRGFLLCYTGAVILVGALGASAYQALQHQRAALSPTPGPMAVADAEPPPAINTPSTAATQAAPAPKPRQHIVKATKPNGPDHRRAMIARAPVPTHHQATTASARPFYAPEAPGPYSAPPAPRYPGPYAYPAQYPDYYPDYYPRYGYYRSF